ncbi:MAG: leucyl aminopeptidase family protein [Rhizobiaceae bacterium]
MAHPMLSTRKGNGIPVHVVSGEKEMTGSKSIPADALRWARASGYRARKGELCLVPGKEGIAGAIFSMGAKNATLEIGRLPRLLPKGEWKLEGFKGDLELATLAWLLGAYRFDRYRIAKPSEARLVLPDGVDGAFVQAQAEAVYITRDLINLPTNDLGPAELEQAIRDLGGRFKAKVTATRGDALLTRRFPMVHAVGRASASEPRIVDLRWGKAEHPKVTLVGKGVCFDSGGLNIKPGDSMALMKKDMGGAAHVLGLASMIMSARLPVRLRVIVPAVENSISANAFRPGDILQSRKGLTVEIGNTDAEGRLILGDALAWADEESPELLIDMATLTGAARVALGPDLPAIFTDDDSLAADLQKAGGQSSDPMWRLPLWQGYKAGLSSQVADLSHIGKGPMAGSITAALFLQHFVEKAQAWVHFDVYAWTASEKPSCPIGGEAQAIRAIYQVLKARYAR